jgi:hypothetical protein
MAAIPLLKIILKTPGIFSSEGQREVAKDNLLIKIKRRDKRLKKKTQLKLEL